MKSQRKLKQNAEALSLQQAAVHGSNTSIKIEDGAGGAAEAGGGGDDWLPPKVLLKPANQVLGLSEKELDEDLTRILNANNPLAPQNIARFNNKEACFKASPMVDHHVFHFEYEGYLIYTGGGLDDGAAALEKGAGEEGKSAAVGTSTSTAEAANNAEEEGGAEDKSAAAAAPNKNQFNYSERAAQTVNNPSREKSTNTEPPPQRTCSFTVNQWTIYDAYVEDAAQKERAQKEKAKAPAAAANTKHKGDDEKASLLPPASEHGPGGVEEVYYKNAELRKMMVVMERMANQNTYDEISQDYKYWEDASDDLGDRKSGKLLPLWKFMFQKDKKKQVTAVCWNPQFSDLFAVGYGCYDFSRQGPGMIACFTLKNPSYPEFTFSTESGVMCLHFHPQHPSMLAVGLHDGSVVVFNIQKKGETPLYRSGSKGRHTEPVWQVCWQKDNLDDNLNFCSVSSDGRITQWTLLKNELLPTDVIALKDDAKNKTTEDELVFSLIGGCCFDFHKKSDHLFVVGTEEGKIFKCSKDYTSQYLLEFEGHKMAAYSVQFNPFQADYFLSCSSDWLVKLWGQNQASPILSFDLNASVGDIAWAPYSSTVFAAATAEGKVFVFDLHQNKYGPMCEQQVVKKGKLTHVSFNPFQPIILVGDDKGNLISLKLSPNLRKMTAVEDQIPKFDSVIDAVTGKASE